MKLLIMLLIISCGKHITPEALDLADADGDLISNHEEELRGSDKFIADIHQLQEIRGKMEFYSDRFQSRKHLFYFSNIADLKSKTLEIFAHHKKLKVNESFFFEWSQLSFAQNSINELTESFYDVYLKFDATSTPPNDLVLIKHEQVLKTYKWSSDMKIMLSAEMLQALIMGEAHFRIQTHLARKESSVKHQTYRVFYKDDEEAKVYYVSKKLPFTDFLNKMKIATHRSLDWDRLLFEKDETKHWYVRELNEVDKVVTYTSLKELKDSYLKGFTQLQTQIGRKNGRPFQQLDLHKPQSALLLINLRPQLVKRTFKDFVTSERHHAGGGGKEGSSYHYYIYYYQRIIQQEFSSRPSLEAFLNEIQIRLDGELLKNDQAYQIKVMETHDDQGLLWQISIAENCQQLQIAMPQRPAETYVPTGVYKIHHEEKPNVRVNPQYTNDEAEYSFHVEAFIEKLN
jgi:hypothetical protein